MKTTQAYRSVDVPCPSCDEPATVPTDQVVERPSNGQSYELHACPCRSMGLWKVA
jgi:hypothetical protein